MSVVYAPLRLPPDVGWAATLAWLGAAGGGGRERPLILIIEDDFAIAQMYRVQLERDGFEVQVAGDGNAGLRLIRERKPDLVLLDVRLPGVDGFEILRAVGGDDELAATPVVVLSNYGDPEMVRTGRLLGAIEYVIKSRTTPQWVSGKVRTWMGGGAGAA